MSMANETLRTVGSQGASEVPAEGGRSERRLTSLPLRQNKKRMPHIFRAHSATENMGHSFFVLTTDRPCFAAPTSALMADYHLILNG